MRGEHVGVTGTNLENSNFRIARDPGTLATATGSATLVATTRPWARLFGKGYAVHRLRRSRWNRPKIIASVFCINSGVEPIAVYSSPALQSMEFLEKHGPKPDLLKIADV